MLKTLPYSALRTLEAVVRLQGFGRAAEELNVTQSAVSQHVKQLEAWLGHQLLVRQNRRTHPTPHGERLAHAIRDGFGRVEAICDELRDTKITKRSGLLVAAPPGFAYTWLLPRLLLFDGDHPDIPISLSTDPVSLDPASSEADIVISYTAGGFPNMHATQLMSEMMAPVCTAQIAASLTKVSDLSQHMILLDTLTSPTHRSNWDFWAQETGVSLPHFPRTRSFSQANMVIQAAESGAGIAMGRSPLIEDALRRGTLVHPFPQLAQSQFSYWFVCRHDALKSRTIQAFRTWITAQASNAAP